jgi:hypothetical protein
VWFWSTLQEFPVAQKLSEANWWSSKDICYVLNQPPWWSVPFYFKFREYLISSQQ